MEAALDNPIWNALVGPHEHLARRRGSAARYEPDVSIFGGLEATTPEALQDLALLTEPGEVMAVLGVEDVEKVGPEWDVLEALPLLQMVCRSPLAPPAGRSALAAAPLSEGDVDEMLALVELTKPGPFERRTIEMGRYVGVRERGRLIAMAGERLALPGLTEISAVCTHPDFLGRGLGESLVRQVGAAIQSRGEVPFLHVLTENARAIALYERLGFTRRSTREITPILRRADESAE